MKLLWSVACAAVLHGSLSSPVRAGDDGVKLGPIDSYSTESEATSRCNGDGVVWADRKTGFLYPRFMEQYGKTDSGTFTCYSKAKKADYWAFGAIDSLGHDGKSFPIDTCLSCY